MQSMRPALGSLAALFACAALASGADPEAPEPDFPTLGPSPPVYCASIADDRQICTWHERNTHHYVCELDAEGRRVGDQCIHRLDNTSMSTFRGTTNYISGRRRRMMKTEMCQTEFTALEAAKSIRQVCEFVGAGPKTCVVDGEEITCNWHAVRRTPGYISLARIARAPGKKLDMTCKFKERGENRESGTCQVYVAGEAPPGDDETAGCE